VAGINYKYFERLLEMSEVQTAVIEKTRDPAFCQQSLVSPRNPAPENS